jgi:hypothetical protein
MVVGYGSPTDTEPGFPAQLKGIGTEASEIFPEKDRLGRLASAAGAGTADRVGFAHVAPRGDVRALGRLVGRPNEEASG